MRRRLALAAAIAATTLACSACAGPTPVVSNGSVSACYRAIPIGRAALHEPKARLIGVHHVPLDYVRGRLPAYARTELSRENDTGVCVMAFKGVFAPGQVTLAPSYQHGSYAIVVVSSRKLHLLAAAVIDHLPRAFGGRTF